MPIGAFTHNLDLPLLLVIAFFLFFLGLVYHLRQEDKREGYPLVSHRTSRSGGRVPVVGFPPLPAPKTFLLPHGHDPVIAPRPEELHELDADNVGNPNGMPIVPRGDGMGAGLGPGSWTMRKDEPELSYDNKPLFQPMRIATDFSIAKGDPDPRGFTVIGCDKEIAGHVVDVWVDRAEHYAKFLEVALIPDLRERARTRPHPVPDTPRETEEEVIGVVVTEEIIETATAIVDVTEVDIITAPVETRDRIASPRENPSQAPAPAGHILLPMDFASVNGSRRIVRVPSITGAQFAGIPMRKHDGVLTAREENQLRGYYGSGYLYATPKRTEPIL